MLELIITPIALFSIVAMAIAVTIFSTQTPLGAASLPCMVMLIALVNFFLMPVLAFAKGDPGFFGMYITSLEWAHGAVALYCFGAGLACVVFLKDLRVNPAVPRPYDPPINMLVFLGLVGLCVVALLITVSVGRLNISRSESYEFTQDTSAYAFVNLFFTTMIPLTVVFAVRDNFGWRTFAVALLVLFVFLQIAFRYRIMLLGFSLGVAFCLTRGIRIRLGFALVGMLCALVISNLIVTTRRYGGGLDLTQLVDMSFADLMQSFGGEVGPLYVLSYTASTPLPDPIGATPWTVSIARLVPSFLWPSKPTADYLNYFTTGFPMATAEKAGIAAPQHVEMLLQFGWFGLPALAFLYFALICLLIRRLNGLGREARIAGIAVIPAFFGFYMQNRGYFFQTLSDAIFLFGPLFLMHLGHRRYARRARRLNAARQHPGLLRG